MGVSLIETLSDVNNTFLARRELVCNFTGLGGKLDRLEAVDMVSKEYKLGQSSIVIPMRLKNHVGKTLITGTFYVYEDEELAKKHVNPSIIKRLERSKKAKEEAAKTAEESSGDAEAEKPAEETAEAKADSPEEAKADEATKDAEPKDAPAETEAKADSPDKGEGE